MKARFLFSALGLLLFMAACQKEELPDDRQAFAPPPSDRCACMPPVDMNANNATDQSIDLVWNNMPEAVAYQVEVGNPLDAKDDFAPLYIREIVEGNRITITGLEPNTAYEYRITTICNGDVSSASGIGRFATGDIRHSDPNPMLKKARLANAAQNQ